MVASMYNPHDDDLKLFVQQSLAQAESRLMAHISTIEQRLNDIEQHTNGVQSRVDSRANDLRGEVQSMRYVVEQINSHIRS